MVPSKGGAISLDAKDASGLEKGENVVLLVQRPGAGVERIEAWQDADHTQNRLKLMVEAKS